MTEKEKKAIELIMEAAKLLECEIAFMDSGDDEMQGIVIGTKEYVIKTFKI